MSFFAGAISGSLGLDISNHVANVGKALAVLGDVPTETTATLGVDAAGLTSGVGQAAQALAGIPTAYSIGFELDLGEFTDAIAAVRSGVGEIPRSISGQLDLDISRYATGIDSANEAATRAPDSMTRFLGLDVESFTGGVAAANAVASVFPQVVGTFLSSPLLGFVSVVEMASSALVGFVRDAVSSIGGLGDDMGEAAEKIGVSVEFLTTVGLAAADAGSSVQGLGDSLKFLNKNASDAASGNKETAAAFSALGIGVLDASGKLKPSEQLFFEVADAIAAIDEPARKTSVAMDLLGRGGTDLIPLLNGGGDSIRNFAGLVDELGGGVDANTAAMGDKFATLQTIIGAAWTGIQTELATPILQFVAAHFDEIVDVVKTTAGELRSFASDVGSAVVPALRLMLAVAEPLAAILSAIGAGVAGVIGGVGSALDGVGDLFGVEPTRAAVSGSGTAGAGPTYNIAVTTPPVDHQAATSEITRRISPLIQQAVRRQHNDFETLALSAATAEGL